MDNYIGNVCPFCKMKIKEGDTVKVCPACGIPHHEGCWEENKGCTTYGCSEQHNEATETNPTAVCSNCGERLGDGHEFCPKCGTPKTVLKKNICGKCGAELQNGQEFCHKCGQKVAAVVNAGVNSAVSQFNAGVNKANNAKKPIKLIIAAVVALAVIVAGVIIAPKLFVSVEDLCAQGNYEQAYAKASHSKKIEVYAENSAAVQSAYSARNMKNPSSFELRDAYYREKDGSDGSIYKYLVLYVGGSNSYGGTIGNYWLYTWSEKKSEWAYYDSYADLTDEEFKSYDDNNTQAEKLLNNIGRDIIRTTMKEGIKLKKDAINRINTMFENGTLDDVELISVTSAKPSTSSPSTKQSSDLPAPEPEVDY